MPKVTRRKSLRQKQKQCQRQNVKQTVKINLVAAARARARRRNVRRGGGAGGPPPGGPPVIYPPNLPPRPPPPPYGGGPPPPPPPPPNVPRQLPILVGPLNVPPLNVPPLNVPPLNVPPLNVPPLNVPPLNVPPLFELNPNYGRDQAIRAYIERFPPRAPAANAPAEPPPAPAVGDAIDPLRAANIREAAVDAYFRRFPRVVPPVPAANAPAVPPAAVGDANPYREQLSMAENDPLQIARAAQAELDRRRAANPYQREFEQLSRAELLRGANTNLRLTLKAVPRTSTFFADQLPQIRDRAGVDTNSDTSSGEATMGYVEPPNPSSKQQHALFEQVDNDAKLNMSESRAHFARLRAANREQIANNEAQRKKADKGVPERKGVPDRKEERKYPQESKEVADREKGIEAQKKIKVEFAEFDAFFGPNPRMGANQLEESMTSFRSNQKELNESIPQFEKGDTSVSMASFEDNQKELNKIIPQVENRLAGADAAAREQQLMRDQEAGIGAGAPRRSGRAHGLQPQLPMSIFARQMHPNVTGRTKERRESMEQKRKEMSLSEIDIRDPTNDLTVDQDLFDNQSLSMRDPTDLQNSRRPIRGWDPDVSSISAGSPYGGSRTIASAQSLEDTISEIENQ